MFYVFRGAAQLCSRSPSRGGMHMPDQSPIATTTLRPITVACRSR